MKLHLGCGERYLSGYKNIDFPPSEHTAQTKTVADQYSNLLELKYEPSSIDEVRLHHVFEHFQRPIAFAFISAWSEWLKTNGVLHIEVPDLTRSALSMLNPFNSRYLVSTRHLFGSHEAHWAVHCEGWSKRSLTQILEPFGFSNLTFKRSYWRNTHNLEVIAKKTRSVSEVEKLSIAESLFRRYLVDFSDSELRILEVWMEQFKQQTKKMIKND